MAHCFFESIFFLNVDWEQELFSANFDNLRPFFVGSRLLAADSISNSGGGTRTGGHRSADSFNQHLSSDHGKDQPHDSADDTEEFSPGTRVMTCSPIKQKKVMTQTTAKAARTMSRCPRCPSAAKFIPVTSVPRNGNRGGPFFGKMPHL